MNSIEEMYLDKRAAAKFLGVCYATMTKLMAAKEITYYKPAGRPLFKKEDLIRWVERGKVKAG
jgi:excisionase family DNA binding protein